MRVLLCSGQMCPLRYATAPRNHLETWPSSLVGGEEAAWVRASLCSPLTTPPHTHVSTHMHMFTYAHVHTHTHSHTHTHLHIHAHVHTHTCTHAHSHMHTHEHTRAHIYACTRIRMHARAPVHTGTHSHTRAYAHTHARRRTYIGMRVHMQTHIHTHTHSSHMCTRTHTPVLTSQEPLLGHRRPWASSCLSSQLPEVLLAMLSLAARQVWFSDTKKGTQKAHIFPGLHSLWFL